LNLTENNQQLYERRILLGLARDSVKCFLYGQKNEFEVQNGLWLNSKLGAFVSIHEKTGDLRGCLGRFTSDIPLHRLICELAVSAASKDYRFPPIKNSDLDQVVFEISVLSPLKRIYELSEIELGKHGIYLKSGSRSGTFLPQVAVENGWDLETFAGRCARDKAGLEWDGWKSSEMYTYTADVFSEKHFDDNST
jgi:AmmeMemoRadiSam system protein A